MTSSASSQRRWRSVTWKAMVWAPTSVLRPSDALLPSTEGLGASGIVIVVAVSPCGPRVLPQAHLLAHFSDRRFGEGSDPLRARREDLVEPAVVRQQFVIPLPRGRVMGHDAVSEQPFRVDAAR